MHLSKRPFFSIISVSYKDAWALTKTARSAFRQKHSNFEYIIIDGNSNDGTRDLTDFWRANGLVDKSIHEPDTGVYDAMNKGIDLAEGEYTCFLNSGDIFSADDILLRAEQQLAQGSFDGCLAWGELNGKVWGSWHAGEAFKMSSLGFCHQALFVRTSLLDECRFDDRKFKTDSDTLQLGRLYKNGARIPLIQEVWAIRGGEPGISANLDRTRTSILDTLGSEYPNLTEEIASDLLEFRRTCKRSTTIISLLNSGDEKTRQHLALMVLDTLFQKPSKALSQDQIHQLLSLCKQVLGNNWKTEFDNLISAQTTRAEIMMESRNRKDELKTQIGEFATQESKRFERMGAVGKMENPHKFSIALTSFPARISTLHFVIRSLVEQTVKADSINLFLGRDEIPNHDWLPSQLREFEAAGLVIHFVDKTCHQYDKFLHQPGLNEESSYVIVDDDVIYKPHSMQRLVEGHSKHPHAIIGNRCHLMAVNEAGAIGPYSDWERESQCPQPSFRLIPTGAGGVLYPPGFFTHPSVTDVRLILKYAPYADDIWLKFNALAMQKPTFATDLSSGAEWYHRYTPTMRAGTLMAENVSLGLNDMQIKQCEQWLTARNPNWRTLLTAQKLEVI
ncbi:MAG: glycosyltransferase [Henriciella sp.]